MQKLFNCNLFSNLCWFVFRLSYYYFLYDVQNENECNGKGKSNNKKYIFFSFMRSDQKDFKQILGRKKNLTKCIIWRHKMHFEWQQNSSVAIQICSLFYEDSKATSQQIQDWWKHLHKMVLSVTLKCFVNHNYNSRVITTINNIKTLKHNSWSSLQKVDFINYWTHFNLCNVGEKLWSVFTTFHKICTILKKLYKIS